MKTIRSLLVLTTLCFGATPLLYAQQESLPSPPPSDISAGTADSSAIGNSIEGGVKKYLLGPGDVLDLRVFGEPQFSDKLQVTDEGNVEVAFIGMVPAKCRTDIEIKRDIVKELKRYLKNPQVSLRIAEARSRPPAVVFGAVRSAQRVQMQRRARLLELLAISGGVTDQAGGDIQIFHTESLMCPEREAALYEQLASVNQTAPPVKPEPAFAKPEVKNPSSESKSDSDDPAILPSDSSSQASSPDEPKIEVDELAVPFSVYKISDLKLGKPEANPVVRPGDIIIIGEATPVYITGAVVSPQGIALREKLPITRAFAMVGGLRKDAKPKKIRIYRQNQDSKEQQIVVVDYDAIRKQKQPDFFLQPYDVVEVPDDTGFKKTLFDVLRGTVPNAAMTLSNTLPYRVLY